MRWGKLSLVLVFLTAGSSRAASPPPAGTAGHLDGTDRSARATGEPKDAPAFLGSRLSFTDWYVDGLRGSAEGAFAFAARAGLDGVEVNPEYDGNTPRLLRSELLRKQYLDAQKKFGIRISSFCLGDLWVDKLATEASSVEKIESLVDLCALMDVRVILLPAFVDYDDPGVTERVVERLRTAAARAEASRVVLCIENYLSAARNRAIVKRVGSPALKVYYDVGNSSQRGFDIEEEIRSLGDDIGQIHVKDYTGLFGRGKINFPRLRQALVDIDYDGWLVLELEPGMVKPLSLEAGYRADADYLKRLFSPAP